MLYVSQNMYETSDMIVYKYKQYYNHYLFCRLNMIPLWVVGCVVDLLKCREVSSHQKVQVPKNGGAVPF